MPDSVSAEVQRVLVVDDTPLNVRLVEACLVSAGYEVTMASSGAEALALFEGCKPDLVLLDIVMPGMDGFQVISRLRELVGGAETPIVFFTAENDSIVRKRVLESGADDFLSKPIDRIELLLRVRSLVRLKRIHNELVKRESLISSQRDILVAAQQQKADLTGFIVHDLKNPLMGILANAQFVARDPSLGDIPRKSLLDILSAGESLHRMIMNLVDISRSEEGTLLPVMEDFDMTTLMEEVSRAVARRAESRRQVLHLDLRLATPMIRGDRDLIRRLLENLLDNALRYAPRDSPIEVSAMDNAEALEIRVGDLGAVVPAACRTSIFEKTVALAGNSNAEPRAGRAMGLAFCSIAARAHGGHIWVEDNVPSGSVFCVSLPV